MKPSPISTAPMTWLGVHDMLWQLTGIQKEYFKSQGGKATTVQQPLLPTRRSLRKRKPVQALLQELSTREPSEVPEPPRKRNKISKPEENEKGSEATLLDPSDASIHNKAGPSELPHDKSTVSSSHDTQGNVDVTPSPLTITSSLPPESHSPGKDALGQAGISRGRSKDALGKKVQAPSRSSVRRTRERSPSFSSGSSTAVSAAGGNSKRARSSSSASSTSTTVVAETGTNSRKGKGKAKADLAPEEETEEDDDETAGKRSTRTRRSSARDAAGSKPSRKQGGTTGLRSSAEIDKLAVAEAPPRRVRSSRSGVTSSRSRKSRKS
jgi:hypothetical protein